MQGTNVLFGQIAVVFGIVIAGVWAATQWTAAALGYQLRLGSPWFDFFGTPVYHPWRLFEWWFFFDAYAPHVFDVGGAIAAGSGLFAVMVAIGMSIWRSRQSKLVTTYGSARWANEQNQRQNDLVRQTTEAKRERLAREAIERRAEMARRKAAAEAAKAAEKTDV